jgi:integrase
MRLQMGITKSRHGTTYYAIKKVPPRLQEAVARVLGRDKQRQVFLKRSLHTKDAGEANRRAKAVQIEFDRILEQAQELLAERPVRDTLSDTEIKLIADHHYADMLHSDDAETREGLGRDTMMRAIAKQLDAAGVSYTMPIPPSENTPQFGLSDADMQRRTADLQFELPIMKAALASGDVSKVSEHLDELLDLFGINLDRKSEAYRRLGLAVLRRNVAALEAIQKRTEGQPIETPPLSAVDRAPSPSGETLKAAFEGWKRDRERSPRTLIDYERATKLFTELHGDISIANIRRVQARQFREALKDVPLKRTGKLLKASLPELAQWGHEHPEAQKISAATINKLLGGVQTVCRWARKEHLLPDDWADPFADMRLDEGDSERAPFEADELRTIFSTPVFTKGERPKGGQGEAAFWLPLLALFGGERLSELGSLRASDVAYNAMIGAPAIHIHAEAKAGKRIKTKKSERYVPVHPQLVELGFLDFVAARGKAHGEKTWLFPQLAPGTTGAASFSKWFGRYIGTHGVTDAGKVFHSFRHNFIDAMRMAGVSAEINTALVGHSDGSVHGKYGAKDAATRFRHLLHEAVERVAYPGLDLSRLKNATGPDVTDANSKSTRTAEPVGS